MNDQAITRFPEGNVDKNYTTKKMLPVELIYFEAYRLKKDAFEREKQLKKYGSALRNLKLRIINSVEEGGAG